MKPIKRIYKWVTATRLRKIMSSVLAVLIVVTSIRYVFVNPKEVLADTLISMNEGYGSSTSDSNGSVSAGTITGALWRTDDLCKDEKCLFFDGTQDYVSFSDDVDLDFAATNDFTISGWFRHAPKTSGTDVLVAKMNSSDNDGGYQVQMESDGDITCEIDDDDADTTIDDSATSTAANYDDNQWHFFACVKSGTTSLTLYIDGVQVAQDASISQTTTLANDDPFTIGIDGDLTSSDYTGFIDEIKIVRRALSATEIAADFLGGTITFTGSGPVGYWKLDEAGDATRNDSSGNGNNLTESAGDTIDQTTGKYNSAADFEKDDTEYLEIADASQTGLDLGNTFTLSAWLKPESASAENDAGIMTKLVNGGDYSYGWGTYGSAGQNNFILAIDDDGWTGGGVGIISGDNIYTVGIWQHFAITYNGSIIRLYKNGVEQISGSFPYLTTITPHNGTAAFRIGQWEDVSQYFDGAIDEAKVYNYARSSTQILEDMVANPPSGVSASFGPDQSYLSNGLVGYWKLDESSGSAADASGNGLTLTNNGTTTYVGGKFGNGSEHVPASSQYLSTATTITGAKTVSFWTNPDSTTNYMISLTSGAYITASGGTISATGFTNPSIYVNGVASTTLTQDVWQLVTVTTDTVIDANQFYVGRQGSNYYDGTLDEVRVYNRPFTPAEVAKLYAWAPGPVGHWKMDENTGTTSTFDSSTNNNTGTLTGSMTASDWIPGKFGSALDFDGSDDYVSTTSTVNPGTSDFTLEQWINPTTLTCGCTTFGQEDGSGTGRTWVEVTSGGVVQSFLSGSIQSSGYTTTAKTWLHVALVHNNSANTLSWYINGVPYNQNTGVSVESATGNFRIAASKNGEYFNGKVDEVRIYNYVRTQSQIVEDMNGGHPAPGSPVGSAVAYWKMDEGYLTTAYDSNQSTGGAEDLTLSSASWTNSGKFGKAWNGTGALWVSRADDDDLDFAATDDFSISLWFKSDSASNPGATEWILNKSLSGGTQQAGYAVYVNTSGQICFGIDDDTTWTPDVESCTSTDYYDAAWHHIMAVRNVTSDTTKIYVDAVEKDSDTDTTTATLANARILYIGDRQGADGGDELNGDVDEVKIYRSALNADQIKAEYNHGSGQALGALSTDSTGIASWSDTDSYCPPGQGSTCTPPVAHWKLDENTGTTANDSTGNANTGTITAGSGTWIPGKLGGSYSFDNAATVINAGSATSLDDLPAAGMTIEAWVYPKSAGEGSLGFIAAKNSGTTPSSGWILRLNSTTSLTFTVDGSTDLVHTTNTSLITQNAWNHVVVSWDGVITTASSAKIYINGVEATYATTTNGASRVSDAASTFYIGNDSTSARTFDGYIDNVMVYNYARSLPQIAWDYNRGGPVGWWKMDESSWNNNCSTDTVFDSSGNAIHGDACPSSTGPTGGASGKFNNAGLFDGSNDYVIVPRSTTLEPANVSVSAWVKSSDPTPTSNDVSIVQKFRTEFDSDSYALYVDYTTNGVNFEVRLASSGCGSGGITGIWDNSWHHILGTFDGTDARLYVDGVLRTTGSCSGTLQYNTADVYIGSRGNLSNYFYSGSIDDVRIYNYALTSQQVKTVMNNGSVTRFGPLQGSP